jgi:uncharacterized protein YjbJ (UPF0337 family)
MRHARCIVGEALAAPLTPLHLVARSVLTGWQGPCFRFDMRPEDPHALVTVEHAGGCVNRQDIKHSWSELRRSARATWGELTEEDLDQVAGRRLALVGRIQRRYGRDLRTAEDEVDDWLAAIDGRVPHA